jgi:hypothetical protein
MGSKFRFKLNGSEMIFDKKNDFINFCQKKYKESENGKLKSKASYSFNDGETWSDISLFKYYRQDIQNEKQPQNESRNYSEKGESKSGWGWGTYLIIVLWIWIGLTFIDSKVKRIDFIHRINTELKKEINKNNQEVVPNTQNNEETITEDNSLDGINDEPIQNEVNSQTETNDNSTTNNSKLQQNSSNTIQCSNCSGLGYELGCPRCKNGYLHCRYCSGNRYDRNGRVCLDCNGTGIILCDNCGGSYSTFKKKCFHCDGKKIVKLELCTSCKGLVKKPGDEWYSIDRGGTLCDWCGGDGYTEETIIE